MGPAAGEKSLEISEGAVRKWGPAEGKRVAVLKYLYTPDDLCPEELALRADTGQVLMQVI